MRSTADMQTGVNYNGVSNQIQQFMVGRGPLSVSVGPLNVPSHMFALNNSHDLPSQTCKQRNPTHSHQQSPGELQTAVQQLDLSLESPDNPSPRRTNLKQKIQGAQEGLTEEDIGVGEHGEKGSEVNRWPREETLALLRIRSLMDTNFRDSNVKGPVWENVSRKLAELGFCRSAKKCKEKFENVNKYYKKTKDGRIGRQDGKSYRFFSELEALYSGVSAKNGDNNNNDGVNAGASINRCGIGTNCSALIDNINPQTKSSTERTSEADYNRRSNLSLEMGSSDEEFEDQPCDHREEPRKSQEQQMNRKKRKRKTAFVSMKYFFENMVKQMMDHQEKLQKKFLEAMEKRDHDRLIREEAWKRQEMARLNREIELRAQEHALASSREAAIVGFLEKVTGKNLNLHDPQKNDNGIGNTTPIISVTPNAQQDQNIEKENVDPHCKRWPKAEVYALIRLRSGMEHRFKGSGPKVSLWEEISSGMACMGFDRSAKRCKEKWENINKYFRKTKGSMKNRPLNAKTCPYFHQLDILYSKGVLFSPSNKSNENLEIHSGNLEGLPDTEQDRELDQKIMEEELQANNDQDSDQLLAIIPASQVSVPARNSDETAQSFPTHKRMELNENPLENIVQTTDEQHVVASNSCETDTFPGSNNNNKRMKMTERLVKEMIKMQQDQHQKFLNDFEKREQEQELRDLESRHHYQHHPPQQQLVLKPTEEQRSQTVSQSALMALVHKLTANYSISPPAGTE